MSSEYPDENVEDVPKSKPSLVEKFQQLFHKEKKTKDSQEYYRYGSDLNTGDENQNSSKNKQKGLVWWEYIVIAIEIALVIFTVLVFFNVVKIF